MNSLIRRKLLGLLGSSAMARPALLLPLPRPIPQHSSTGTGGPARLPEPQAGESGDDPLLPDALQWVERLRGHGTAVLLYPVSRLQREFMLGYTRACALAGCLAQRGEWTIAYDAAGTRFARIHRVAREA